MNDELNASAPSFLSALIAQSSAVDGQPPFSDQSLVELDRGERTLIETEHGAAIFSGDEVELVIHPHHRGSGHGTELAARVLREQPKIVSAWAHGDHPAAKALAKRYGFAPVRTLLQLRTELDGLSPHPAAGSISPEDVSQPRSDQQVTETAPTVSPFRPGVDDSAWLALNAEAFAHHPEQGRITQRDLDDRSSQPWFDANDFLIMRDGADMIGFCWLKVDGPIGEIYAVGTKPDRQGEGLGRLLMDAAFARLRGLGITTVALYVEADNAPALALYHRYGFTQHSIDVRYQHEVR